MILDLFAGPGGWSEGLRSLGLSDVGIEWDAAACNTRRAAGHLTIQADVAQYPTAPFVGRVEGLIASPPCQDFSMAGKRAGLQGDKGQLIHEVLRWTRALEPVWVACEQVPPALPVWDLFSGELRSLGYRTWAGVLNAADYGVPQTRTRAFLMAHSRALSLPEPTHAQHPEPAGLFGDQREGWVSMAEALGWDAEWAIHQRRGAGMVDRHGDRPNTPVSEPAPAVTGSLPRRWLKVRTGNFTARDYRQQRGVPYERDVTEPAPTVTGAGNLTVHPWVFDRPATTVCMDNAVKITVQEASVLQGFPADYPWQGTKTKQFEQVGNAVPPPLAAAVLSALIGDRQGVAAA